MSSGRNNKLKFEELCDLTMTFFIDFEKNIDPHICKLIGDKSRNKQIALTRKLFQQDDRIDIPTQRDLKKGVPISLILKEQFEAAFDTNLEKVKIHTGEYASELTRSANSEAVTIGSDIFFSMNHFNLDSEEGLVLLAHELQHVVQYNSGKPMRFREDVAQMEAEADRVEGVLRGNSLHGLQSGILNQSEEPETEKQNGSSENRMAPLEIGNTGNLDDFNNCNTEPIHRLHIGGKVYEVSRKERDLIISRAAEKLEEKLLREVNSSSMGTADDILMRFLQFIS